MAAGRIILPCMPALDSNGRPVSGALLNFYVNNTTTRKAVYTTADLNVALPNPVVADAAGAFPSIFADEDELYSVTCFSPAGVMLPKASYSSVQATTAIGDGLVLVSSFMQTVLDDPSADAARATLNAAGRDLTDVDSDATPTLGGIAMAGAPSLDQNFAGYPAKFLAKVEATGASAVTPEIANYTSILATGGGADPTKFKIGLAAVALAMGDASDTFAANFVASANPDANVASSLVGLEIDVNVYNVDHSAIGHPYAAGLYLTGAGTHTATAAILADYVGAGPIWNWGLAFHGPAVASATFYDDTTAPTVLKILGTHTYGVDLHGSTLSAGAMRLPNNKSILARNGANSSDSNLLYLDPSDQCVIGQGAARLFAGQQFSPLNDNAFSCGRAGNRWSEVWAVTGTINTSDKRLKTDFRALPGSALDFVASLAEHVQQFRWISGGMIPKIDYVDDLVPALDEAGEEIWDREWLLEDDGVTPKMVQPCDHRGQPLPDLSTGKPYVDGAGDPIIGHDGKLLINPTTCQPMAPIQASIRTRRMIKGQRQVVTYVDRPGVRNHVSPIIDEAFIAKVLDYYGPEGFGGLLHGEDGYWNLRGDQWLALLMPALAEERAARIALEARVAAMGG